MIKPAHKKLGKKTPQNRQAVELVKVSFESSMSILASTKAL